MDASRSALSWPEVIARVRYKPGWKLEAGGDHGFRDEVCARTLRVTVATVDPASGETQIITHPRLLPPVRYCDWLTEDTMVRAIFEHLVAIERHEAGEFFVYGDARPFDPHAKQPSEARQ